MSDRITTADLADVLANLNRRLPDGVEIHAQGRNGYTGLDEYRGTVQTRTLLYGTKRECYNAAWHMIRGIDLANTEPTR